MFQKILERMANATPDTQYLRDRISCKICFTRLEEFDWMYWAQYLKYNNN